MPWTTRKNRVRVISLPDPIYSTPYLQGFLPTFVHRTIAAPNPRYGTYYSANSTSITTWKSNVLTSGINIMDEYFGWPSTTYAPWTQYSGTFSSYDDGYTNSPINIGFTWYMGGTGYSQLYVSTNGYVSFGSGQGGIYSGTSVPAVNSIMCLPSDQWLQPGLQNLTSNWHDIFSRTISIVMDGVTHYIFQLIVFGGRYGNTTNDNSYILNLFSAGSQQLIEVGIRPESNHTSSVSGPVVPGQTITRSNGERGNTKVWESLNNGTNWSYNGLGCVVPAQVPSTSSGIGGSGMSIRTALHDSLFHFSTPMINYCNTGNFSVTTRGFSGTMYYGSGYSNSTSNTYGISRYNNNGRNFIAGGHGGLSLTNMSLNSYLNKADTYIGWQTYLVNTAIDTLTSSGNPGYGRTVLNTTNSGANPWTLALTDTLNWNKTYLQKSWTGGGQPASYWEARLENWAHNIMIPASKSGSIANGAAWAVRGYWPSHLGYGVHLSHLSDANTGNQNYSGLYSGVASDLPIGNLYDAKCPYQTNILSTNIQKKYDNVIYGGSSQILNTYIYANSTVYASSTKNYYYSGIGLVIANSSISAYAATTSKIKAAGYAPASASYRPYSNTSVSTAIPTVQISNADGTANASTLYANLQSKVDVNSSQIGITFHNNGTMFSYVYAAGGDISNYTVPAQFVATNRNAAADDIDGCHVGISFTGTITMATNHTGYLFDPDEPIRATQSPTTFYYTPSQRILVIGLVSGNSYHFIGEGLTETNTLANAAVGAASSIVGTLTFRNNLTGATVTRSIDVRLNTVA